jgi:hypothetical protein
MNAGRAALLLTCAVVAGLGAWFAIARWEDANKIATVASALGSLAAVGVAIWAVVRKPGRANSITVKNTGKAEAGSGGDANSGLTGKADSVDGDIDVSGTGDAKSTGGGNANSGVNLE